MIKDIKTKEEIKDLIKDLSNLKLKNPKLFYIQNPLLYRSLQILEEIIKEEVKTNSL